ncbi:MAG: NUDIX hydrolase [Gammaproteobacteria bacterium]
MVIPFLSHEVTSAPLPSATVMVLRDGQDGLEVLMVRRHGNAGVLGGAHVFPGGKLDPADAMVPAQALDLAPQACALRLGETTLPVDAAVALHVAALRETWEEVGLLLGLHGCQQSRWQALAQRVAQGQDWSTAMMAEGLTLPVSALVPWSRWITPRLPSVSSKRFDTRFFLARAPAGQTASHDGHEATEAVWLSPREALHRFWSHDIDLAPPQIISLVDLSRHQDAASAWAHAAGRQPPLIEPHPFDRDGCRVICYPGDPEHPVPQPAWPGPTRLTFRNRRFEPDGGLAALLP